MTEATAAGAMPESGVMAALAGGMSSNDVGDGGPTAAIASPAVQGLATELPLGPGPAAATAGAGVPGWGLAHPKTVGIWTWSDNFVAPPDVRTRGLELICCADGSGAVRFKIIQQSLAAEGGDGCEQDDVWNWQYGTCAAGGNQLQFNVRGQYTRSFPNGYISPTCNPSMNTGWPISDVITFPFWQVVGTPDKPTLDVTVPATLQGYGLPNMALSLYGNVPSWSPFESLGGYFLDGFAASSWGPERLDVFGVGSNHALLHTAWNGSVWSPWTSLGGVCITAPAAVSWGANRIDVFVVSSDHAVHHQWFDGTTWSGWKENLGEYALLGVAAASRGPGQLSVFAVGSDHAIWHRDFNNNKWSPWQSLGQSPKGGWISAPAAVALSNWIDLYAIGADRNVYHNAWHDGAWHGWGSLGGPAFAGVATNYHPGGADVFTIGSDGAVYQRIWNGTAWLNWAKLGGAWISGPASVSWGQGHIDLLVIGADHACHHKWYQ